MLKPVVYLNSKDDLILLRKLGCQEAILGLKFLSRFGKLNLDEYSTLVSEIRKYDIQIVLDFDILVDENQFNETLSFFQSIDSSSFDKIRVQDPGLMQWLFQHTNFLIQMIVETGHHNLIGLQSYESYLGSRLDRLIVNQEIKKDELASYTKALKTPLECLGLGRILLFHTPRKLLAPLVKDHDDAKKINDVSQDFLEALGESEESPHKGFPIVENRHGTFMFHIKDFSLLPYQNDLNEIGIEYLRVDWRFYSHEQKAILVEMLLDETFDESGFKNLWSSEVTRGFFTVNKTDVLFPKLKNHRLARKDGNFMGEVLDVNKEKFIVFKLARSLEVGDEIEYSNPEGKLKTSKISWLKNWDGSELIHAAKGEVVLLPFEKNIFVKTHAYIKKTRKGETLRGFEREGESITVDIQQPIPSDHNALFH